MERGKRVWGREDKSYRYMEGKGIGGTMKKVLMEKGEKL